MSLKSVVEALKMEINGFCTENIAFRLFTRSDAFPLYQATLNPEFNKKLAWGPPESFDDVIVQADLLLREMMSNQSLVVSIVEKDTGAWIGLIKTSIYKDSLIHSLWFHPSYWNKPIIIFASSAWTDLFFKSTGLPKLYAKHAMGHSVTERLVKRSGFVYKYNEAVPHSNGSTVDCRTYELSYENWKGKTQLQTY
jgi:RimJ/RimL family protein N-acetyltransferase